MKTELLTTLKRQGSRLLKELREEKTPILITEHGRPAAYLVDVENFENLQRRVRLLEGIARGERDIQEGNVLSHDQVKERLGKWLK